jgi:Zn/Cd-binding protein ZinT
MSRGRPIDTMFVSVPLRDSVSAAASRLGDGRHLLLHRRGNRGVSFLLFISVACHEIAAKFISLTDSMFSRRHGI